MDRGQDRPMKTRGPPHGQSGAAHTEPTSHGPRPGPAHQITGRWAAARSGRSIFQMMSRLALPGPSYLRVLGRGPARPITFSKFYGPIRSGPSFSQNSRPGPVRPITFSKYSARSGPAHHNFQIGPANPAPGQLAHDKPCIFFQPSSSKRKKY